MPNQPQQARSRETLARLTEAAFAVVCREGFEGATVPEIVTTAGLSTGAFYSRFPSKEALFEHLDAYIFERSLRLWLDCLAPEKWDGAEPVRIIAQFIEGTAVSFETTPTLNRSMAQRWRSPDAPPQLREHASQYYRGITEALVLLLEPHEARFGVPDWRFRIAFLVEVIEATLLERIAFAERAVTTTPMPRERVVSELTEIAASYLRLDHGRTAAHGESGRREQRREAAARPT